MPPARPDRRSCPGACACRACRARVSCRSRSRRARRSPRESSGTRCARGRCARRNWPSATASWSCSGSVSDLARMPTPSMRRRCIRSISICRCLRPATVKTAEVNTIYVAGTNSGIKVGDVVLLVGKQERAGCGGADAPAKSCAPLKPQDALNRTRVEFEGPAVKPLGYGIKLNQAAAISLQAVSLNASSANADCGADVQRAGARGLRRRAGLGHAVAGQLLLARRSRSPRPRPSCRRRRPGHSRCDTRLGFFGHNAPALIAGAGNTGMQRAGSCRRHRHLARRRCRGLLSRTQRCRHQRQQLAGARSQEAARGVSRHDGARGVAGAVRTERQGDRVGARLPAPRRDEKYKVREDHSARAERTARAGAAADRAPIGNGTAEELQLTLDRTVLNLRPGQFLALTGERADLPGVTASEIVTLKEMQHSGGFTTLFFESPGLTLRYVRDTVALNANVALGHARRDGRRGARQRRRRAAASALHAQAPAAHLHRGIVGERGVRIHCRSA